MAFKLGSSRNTMLNKGEIKGKLAFKQDDSSIPGTPVIRKKLMGNVLGESNNDGSIFVSDKVKPGSDLDKQIIMHEMVHQTDMRVGKLAYSDNHIKWNGEIYNRKNGKIFFDNEWAPEGSKHFPWEKMPWE